MLGNECNQGLVHMFFVNKYRKKYSILQTRGNIFSEKQETGKETDWMMNQFPGNRVYCSPIATATSKKLKATSDLKSNVSQCHPFLHWDHRINQRPYLYHLCYMVCSKGTLSFLLAPVADDIIQVLA